MERQKVTNYRAGYGKNRLRKRMRIGLLGVLGTALLAALSGCRDRSSATLTGDVPYYDPDATATNVSASDSGDAEGAYMLDGDVIYEEGSSDEAKQG